MPRKQPAPRGRPTDYTPEVARRICELLAEGRSLRSICKARDMPPESTVRLWALDDREGFAAQYARARDLGLDAMADEVLDIADETGGDPANKRVRFDARRWYLSKLAPKRYGDKVDVQHSGGVKVTRIELVAAEAPADPLPEIDAFVPGEAS